MKADKDAHAAAERRCPSLTMNMFKEIPIGKIRFCFHFVDFNAFNIFGHPRKHNLSEFGLSLANTINYLEIIVLLIRSI